MHNRKMPILIALCILLTLVAAFSAHAQDTTPTTEPTSAAVTATQTGPGEPALAGVGTLVLLVGIGAVLVVGGTMLARDNAQQKMDSE